jgi:hypothetical protein
MDQHGNNINDPAYSENADGNDPKKPDNYPSPEYAVDTLNQRIKEKSENKDNKPTSQPRLSIAVFLAI